MERDLEAIFGLGERGAQAHAERNRQENPWDHGSMVPTAAPAKTVEYLPPTRTQASPIPALLAVGLFLVGLVASQQGSRPVRRLSGPTVDEDVIAIDR